MRNRPMEHSRNGVMTSKGYRSPTTVNAGVKKFRQAVTLQNMGAKPLKVRNHTFYELEGGLFTKNQLLRARKKFYTIRRGFPVKNRDIGL